MTAKSLSAPQIHDSIFEKLGDFTQSLGSPSRLRLIHLLAQGPKTVEMLSLALNQSTANTSQHLQKLRKEKLVRVKKKGSYRFYEITDPHISLLWEVLQELGHRIHPELDIAENRINPTEFRTDKSWKDILNDLHEKRSILLDVRDPSEYRFASIEEAIAIPLEELSKKIPTFNKKQKIYVVCRGRYCRLATFAVQQLRSEGFHAFRIRDGIHRLEFEKRGMRL